ncbi:MAG: hypothetical protein EBQ71_06745 [Betaproteobacteria bacterium]|nr:hypothetical protein [Betaproteobacteria bacterium]
MSRRVTLSASLWRVLLVGLTLVYAIPLYLVVTLSLKSDADCTCAVRAAVAAVLGQLPGSLERKRRQR